MKKSKIALVVTGSLIGIGIILSFYGNYVLFEGLAQTSGEVSVNNDLILEVDLDSTKSQKGIFAVQMIDYKGQIISVSIVDSFDNTIESKTITQDSYEGVFDLQTSGTYKIIVANKSEQLNVFAVIGNEPDQIKRSLAWVSLYILVFGLIGMALVAGLITINRKRAIS